MSAVVDIGLDDVEAYSVIYSVDVFDRAQPIKWFRPPRHRRWDLTECDDWSDEYGPDVGKVKHRKWCALLTPDEFAKFVDDVGLRAEDVETMGSLGAPGFGLGWAPAVSFQADDPAAWQNAYVTPIPKGSPEDYVPQTTHLWGDPDEWAAEDGQRLWESLRREVIDEWAW